MKKKLLYRLIISHLLFLWGGLCAQRGPLWWLALLTFGEGWHHNHHTYLYSARVGVRWYEFDPGYYTIKLMQTLGLAQNVKVPKLIPPRRNSRAEYGPFQGEELMKPKY